MGKPSPDGRLQNDSIAIGQNIQLPGQDFSHNQMGSGTFRRFVAGPSVIERNPLSEPLGVVGSANYAKFPAVAASTLKGIEDGIKLRNYDLKNEDTKVLRYEHLMKSQYYNL